MILERQKSDTPEATIETGAELLMKLQQLQQAVKQTYGDDAWVVCSSLTLACVELTALVQTQNLSVPTKDSKTSQKVSM